MMRCSSSTAVFLAFGTTVALLLAPATVRADLYSGVDVTLNGSRASMLRQNTVARQELYSFLRTPTQVLRHVDDGYLVPVAGNADYSVIAGYPFARPVVRSFVERLAADYRAACGEQLVVTSLTRPAGRQPGNASPLSVHPAGMAVDLRVSARASCRDWLTDELLTLEERGLIDATREYHPPHFHVAVFPAPFEAYDQTLAAQATIRESLRRIELAVAARLDAEAAADLAAETAAQTATIEPAAALLRVARLIARIVLPLNV